jgi:hypothetical protein
MKKTAVLILASIITIASSNRLQAQGCTFYFPSSEGTEIELEHFDKKENSSGITRYKVLKKVVEGDDIKELVVDTEIIIPDSEYQYKRELSMKCEDGRFSIDMESYLSGMNFDAYQDMDMVVESESMYYPASFREGEYLNDGWVSVKISKQDFTIITIRVDITERKYEGMEEITTPAGTFNCHKISYNSLSKTGFVTVKGSAIEWFAENVGVVRSETFNKKGKLEGYSQLRSIK